MTDAAIGDYGYVPPPELESVPVPVPETEADAAQLQADKDRFLQGQTDLGLVARP
jgi:hypothetical protein